MGLTWTKLGKVYSPSGEKNWSIDYVQKPAVLVLNDRFRVFYSTRGERDANGESAAVTTYVDLDKRDFRVLEEGAAPVLSYGELGTFDQFGAMACSVTRVGDEVWMYYGGWNRCRGVPYNHAIGLAISKDGKQFSRYARGPILSRTPEEPYIHNSPYVARFGDKWHMWYGSGTGWVRDGNKVESVYVTMHATSDDAIHWQREAKPCIPSILPDECQASATVIDLGGIYHMWFSYRCGTDFRNADGGYRTGHAVSHNLTDWQRDDEDGVLLTSSTGWDSEMVCYPCVVETGGRVLMFYCGNYFGQGGLGVAELQVTSS